MLAVCRDLSYNGLTGTVPANIGDLSLLTRLCV